MPMRPGDLVLRKQEGLPITVLTAWDALSAQVVAEAGADALLVGDSLAMTVLGHDTTLPVSLDEMLHHCRAGLPFWDFAAIFLFSLAWLFPSPRLIVGSGRAPDPGVFFPTAATDGHPPPGGRRHILHKEARHAHSGGRLRRP